MKFPHFLIFIQSEGLSLTKSIGRRGETRDRASTAGCTPDFTAAVGLIGLVFRPFTASHL